jgi:tetratricopeptide (TPR) repeat protein
MKRALLAALLSLALVGPLRAQESADETKKAAVLEEARQHVARAKVHYDLGEFKEAADEYILVYRLRPIAALLFNIAQAYRQGGLYDKARQFYKSYLREAPEAKNRAIIEQDIRQMDELIAKDKRARESPPTGVKEPAEAALPLSAKAHPDKAGPQPAPTTVVEAPKPAEPAKASALPKPGEASAPKPEAIAAAKPVPNPARTEPAPAVAPKPETVAAAKLAPNPARTEPAPAAARGPAAAFKAPLTPAPLERQRTWTWVAAGASVVALGGGAAFGYKTINGGAPSDARTANILYGVGAALAIASAALFVFEF